MDEVKKYVAISQMLTKEANKGNSLSLQQMVDRQANHSTPCDIPDENGEHHCPYEGTYTGFSSEMCRVMCGEGVDE